MKDNITISEKSQGERLDKFLTAAWPDYSRSQIQKMIKIGEVLIDGKKKPVHYFLKTGDKIEIKESINQITASASLPKKNSREKTASSKKNLFAKIKIIADENDYLIIEKPAGLLVHPTEKNEDDTLVDWLLSKYPELKKIGEDPGRPAIVHRLDKEVSGLMIIPRNQNSFDYFKNLFQKRKIKKKYLALVYGQIEKDDGEINFPIGRSKTKSGIFAARPQKIEADDKHSITYFKTLKRFKKFTLLEVEILTGRTHQIRVHLLAFGHPIVGDPLYKNSRFKPASLDRIFLHAYYLAFGNPDGEKRLFSNSLPKTLNDFLNQLK